MKRIQLALALAVATLAVSPAFAVKKGEAKFMGGTIRTVAEGAEGPIDIANDTRLIFIAKKNPTLEIPWASITQMEYGQKVARRWRSAILLSPLALFHKAKKHFVTVTYKDEAKAEQAIVFEFDNDDIRMVLASLKARTGQSIVMQDDEAKKELGGGSEKK